MRSATLARAVELTGRGLFSGESCRARLSPAPAGTGLTLARLGSSAAGGVPLTIDFAVERPSCTVISGDGVEVAVVEHLLAALWAAGIDTAQVEVDGPEIPNQDGSALPLYLAISHGGRIELGARSELSIRERVEVKLEGGSSLSIEPASMLSVEYFFSHPDLGEQSYSTELDRATAIAEILPSRSFITEAEAERAMAAGLLRNANAQDALVLRGHEHGHFPAVGQLRFPDEFARHKALDLIGDLYLLPFEFTGKLTAHLSGHRLNRALARKLMARFRAKVE